MPLSLQVKLLRVLETGIVEPMGSNEQVPVDVRVIAAANRNLEAMMVERTFREDLYSRLNVIRLVTPPLRERLDDLPSLCKHHVDPFCRQQRLPIRVVSPTGIERLRRYDWPRNIRELNSVLSMALIWTDGESLQAADLEPFIQVSGPQNPVTSGCLNEQWAECERKIIQGALDASHGFKTKAAERLCISRATLYEKIEKLWPKNPPDRRHLIHD